MAKIYTIFTSFNCYFGKRSTDEDSEVMCPEVTRNKEHRHSGSKSPVPNKKFKEDGTSKQEKDTLSGGRFKKYCAFFKQTDKKPSEYTPTRGVMLISLKQDARSVQDETMVPVPPAQSPSVRHHGSIHRQIQISHAVLTFEQAGLGYALGQYNCANCFDMGDE